jgi:hypothetical protein
MKGIFQNLMQASGLDASIEALRCKIKELGEEITQLEGTEVAAWENLQKHDSSCLLADVQMQRKQKNWGDAINHLSWIEAPDSLPNSCITCCFEVWRKLKDKHRERVAYENLRSFHEDLESSMNLDNRYDMADWELVDGGDTGRNVSESRCGVFKAKRLDDNKIYAVKCVTSEGRQSREVESHSVLLHRFVLQYSGDYSTSSSHFLAFILRDTSITDLDLMAFSDMYSESRNFLYIASEFCEGGSMLRYVHGHLRPNDQLDMKDATYMPAHLFFEDESTKTFKSIRSHHLYVGDHVVMFPPGCENEKVLPYLAKVVRVSDSESHEFSICRVLVPGSSAELFAKQYFIDLNLQRFPEDSQLYYLHYVLVSWEQGTISVCRSGKTSPRPGFSFLRNFCFQAIHALWDCSLKDFYHGDVRLENFFLRKVVRIHDVLGGDDGTCRSVGVQLGDFDLATADKVRSHEFSRDRYQLVVAL